MGRRKVRSHLYGCSALIVVTKILELAGKVMDKHGCKNIAPRRLPLAVRNDEELANIMSCVMISTSGFMTEIHPSC